ncbi:MAG: hypothetical protein LCH84_06965 [Gemmatimonadetes bacterium]|nr:hypothetical protein [Gemmatimonadota bacterium]
MSLQCRGVLALGLAVASLPLDVRVAAQAQSLAPPSPTVRDSLGVRVVEYPTLAPMPSRSRRSANPLPEGLDRLAPAFRLEPTPFLDIGGVRQREVEELDAQHPLLGAVVLASGVVVVNDRVALKFFSADGRLLHVAGRRGRGPVEFQQTRSVCEVPGTGVLAFDLLDGRVSVWTERGAHLRTFARMGALAGGACGTRGEFAVARAETTKRLGTQLRVEHVMVDASGRVVRRLGMLPAAEFLNGLQLAPSVVPTADGIVVGAASVYELQWRRRDGTVRQIARLSAPVAAITAAEWRAHVEATVPRGGDPAARRARIARMLAQHPNGSFPAFATVLVDPQERVWVQDYENATRWTVFRPDGTIVGRMTFALPGLGQQFRLLQVGADFVLVREDDDDGAAHIRAYRFRGW